jgi:hypothetical protein
VNSLPSACLIEQFLPIVRSRLTQATALQALALTYREGAGTNRGEWLAKAEAFEKAADAHFNLVVSAIVDEFDADNSGAITPTEVTSVTAVREPWSWSRG